MNIDNRSRLQFMALTRSLLRTARAWAMKETAATLWRFEYRKAAETAWLRLTRWMLKSRLKPMIALAKTIRSYLWGIVNAAVTGVTNAISESKNTIIQKIKANACGFRNRHRFRNAILFNLGGLDMAPTSSMG
jgi:transposase